MRGYGRSSKPLAVEDYRMVRLVADNVGLVGALGERARPSIVGHDWGAPIAWTSALLRPDVFTAVAGLSVPFSPPSEMRPLAAMRAMAGDEEFYIEYFQEPGRAEAEIEADVRDWLLGFMFTASGDAPPPDPAVGHRGHRSRRGALMKDRFHRPDPMPAWLTEADLDVYASEFEHSGFRGPLNRYRNVDRDWEDLAAFRGAGDRRAGAVHRRRPRRPDRLGGAGDRRVRADAAEAAPLDHPRGLRPLDPAGAPRRGERGADRLPRERPMSAPSLEPVADPQDIAVVGGGMAGMLAALLLARDGHRVTVYERDDTDLPDTADEAFEQLGPARRAARPPVARPARPAPPHAAASGRPTCSTCSLEQGATELTVERILPPGIDDRAPRPGDEELVLLVLPAAHDRVGAPPSRHRRARRDLARRRRGRRPRSPTAPTCAACDSTTAARSTPTSSWSPVAATPR